VIVHNYTVRITEVGAPSRTMLIIAKNSITAIRIGLATMITPGRISVKLS